MLGLANQWSRKVNPVRSSGKIIVLSAQHELNILMQPESDFFSRAYGLFLSPAPNSVSIVVLVVTLLATAALKVEAGSNMTPVAVTGWNADVVVENTASGPPFTSVASEVGPGGGNAYYQTGLPQYAWGMPPSGAFVSFMGDNTIFQFQPYTTNNALILSNDTGLTFGTLTLATSATYASIAILANSANGTNQTGTCTLHFNDGSSYATTFYAPDWIGGTANVAWFGSGQINLTNGVDSNGLVNPRFYQTTLNLSVLLGSTNKPLVSITFNRSQAASTAIYAVSGLAANGTPSVAAPIGVSGFNRDLVVENTASGPPFGSYAQELNGGEGQSFYQSGLPGKSYGLPLSGSFQSMVDATTFQFQPFTGNNALVMSLDTGVSSGTLTLNTPAIYNGVSLIANSANATATSYGQLTLNFSDGSSFVTNYYAADWFGNSGFALQGMERINLSTGATQGAPNDPRFYQTTLNLVALFGTTNKPLASVTFGEAPGVGSTAVYALSGVKGNQTGGIYTLATVTNQPATGIQTHTATLGGNVVSTGGTPPEVFIYYGPTDGGTSAAQWAQRIYLGNQTGVFTQNVSGLSGGTTYYFKSAAINPAGIAWAPTSKSFTTVTATAATVTNLPASNVGPQSAVLAGNILATGGDEPQVTLYYGPVNGGTTPAAWAHSLILPGLQSGWLGLAVQGLVTNTTYYFTAETVNAGGTAWGTPVQSFTTTSSNPAVASLISVVTGRDDNARSGQNTNETILTLANVNTNTFGLLFSHPIDGCMVAQPLVLANVLVPGQGIQDLVFAATEHDSVYAFNADNNAGANAAPVWQVSFINAAGGIMPLQSATDLQASSSPGFYGPEVGISGTPVIDPVTGTIYVVAKTKEVSMGVTNFVHRLHALDVATGAEKFGGPVVIQGSVFGVGDGFNYPGIVTFNDLKHMNRPALMLVNGQVCVTFTSHQDFPPYHGWVFTFNAYTLQPTGIFNTTPNGSDGGIWQGSSGPAADASGNVYFETGNGTFDAQNANFGDSVVKLSATNGLNLVDYFAPYNQYTLNLEDIDIGSAGLILLPDSAGSVAHPHLMVAGSKAGVFWLLDRDNLGQFNPAGDTQIVQEISGATRGMWVTPAYFNGNIYYCAAGDRVKGFAISNALINTNPVSQSTATISYPGSSLSVSANGTSNAIVWGIDSSGNQARPAILHAYNATNLAQELYNSSQLPARDNPGLAVKFTMPTIANGKVYIGTANELSVMGSASFQATPVIAPASGVFTNFVQISIASPLNGSSIYYTLDGSTPTTNATFYSGPFVLTNSAIIQAIAAVTGQPISAVASASFISSALVGNGTGLVGQYYANTLYTDPFAGTPLVRTDPTVNFNWNTVSPDPSIPTTDYTVRWTGMVQPMFTGNYTFYTTTDDGVRLRVNGQELVNRWSPQSPTTWSGSITLQALQVYPIEMDYFQAGGGAIAQLAWSGPYTTQTIIPQSQLYPFSGLVPVQFIASRMFGGAFSLQMSGTPGKSYLLQASTNLTSWISLSTNVPSTTVLNFSDLNVSNYPARFYRAVQLP
jgi:hypothetical protein